MKIRSRRLMALLLSAAMIVPYSSAAYAEDAQAAAPVAAEAPAETQPTEPQTQAQTQAETQAQTQAETQAQTQAETQPQTQAETQPQTQVETQPQTQAETTPQTQQQTAADSSAGVIGDKPGTEETTADTEKTVNSFEGKTSGITAKVTLPKGQTLPESTVVTLKVSGAKNSKKAAEKVRKALGKKQKTVSDVHFLTISLSDAAGGAVALPEGTKISFSIKDGLDLGLVERGEGEVHVLAVGDKVKDAGAAVKLSQNGLRLLFAEVSAKGKDPLTYAVAGLQNHVNTGKEPDKDDIEDFCGASGYAVVAGEYDGKKKTQVLTADDQDKDKKEKAQSLLDALAEYSLKLADLQSTDEVRVVNLYADDKGKVNTASASAKDPLYGVAAADGTIDVTSGYLVVNIIAAGADQQITVPKFDITCMEDGKTEKVTEKKHAKYAGHLIVNFASANGKDGDSFAFVPYTGSADVEDEAVGIYLAPDGTISADGSLTGAVCAKRASVGGELTASTVTGLGKDTPAKTDETDHTEETGRTGDPVQSESTAEAGKVTESEASTETEAETTDPDTELTKEETAGKGQLQTDETSAGEDGTGSAIPQEQTDPGKGAAGQESVAGGLSQMARALQTDAPEQSEENSETAEDITAEQAADAEVENADENAFAGTLNVLVQVPAGDGTTSQNVSGVVLSLYEKAAEGKPDTYVCTITSGADKAAVPQGKLKKDTAYVLKEITAPSDGTNSYSRLSAAFSVALTADGTGYEIRLADGETGAEKKVEADPSAAGVFLLTLMHSSPIAPDTPKQQVKIAVKDPSGSNYISGSKITVASETSDGTAASWKQEDIFSMPAADLSYDFTDLLNQHADPEDGDTVRFRISEEAPAGLCSLPNSEDDSSSGTELTFIYTAGNGDVPAGWTLSRTPVYGETDNTIADAAAVTFTDAYQIDLTSSLISYKDQAAVLKADLEGGAISVKAGDTALKAGTDYLVFDNNAGVFANKTVAEADTFPMPGNPVRIVLLSKLAGAEAAVTVTGTRTSEEDYHFVTSQAAAVLPAAANETENGAEVTYSVPALKLTSRKAATVKVSSVTKSGEAHVGSDVTASIAGIMELPVTANPSAATLNSADYDDDITAILNETKKITGARNKTGYVFSPAEASSSYTEDENGTLTITAKLTSTSDIAKGRIVVSKAVYRTDDGKTTKLQRLAAKKTFKVGVYSDENAQHLVDSKNVTVAANNYASGSSNAAAFTVDVDVVSGTSYYVYELDGDGDPVTDSKDLTVRTIGGDAAAGSGAQVTLKAQKLADSNLGSGKAVWSVTPRAVTVRNIYSKDYVSAHPADFKSSGSFGIELRVVDAAGNELPVDNLVGEFRIRSADGKLRLKNNQKITLKNSAKGTRSRISFPVSGTGQDMSVTLMSIKTTAGVSLAKDYTLLTASYDQNFSRVGSNNGERTFTLQGDVDDQGPVVFVLKKNDANEKASLTLTKSVMYKKTPIRVNATYYIGIFSDAAHTKLLFKKAMTLKDASSVSDTLKVNVNSQKNHSITLYFAETDRNGKVVKSGKKTGYNISVSPASVTLAAPSAANPAGNMNATVTVTNEVLDGSKAAKKLTDPSSGFAGDPAALADAQQLAEDTNLDSRTGDENPVARYLMMVLASAAAAGVLIFAGCRRRRRSR